MALVGLACADGETRKGRINGAPVEAECSGVQTDHGDQSLINEIAERPLAHVDVIGGLVVVEELGVGVLHIGGGDWLELVMLMRL